MQVMSAADTSSGPSAVSGLMHFHQTEDRYEPGAFSSADQTAPRKVIVTVTSCRLAPIDGARRRSLCY